MLNLEQYGRSLEQEENELIMYNGKLSTKHLQPHNIDDSKLCSIEDPESIKITGTNIKKGDPAFNVAPPCLRSMFGEKEKQSGRNTTCLYDLGTVKQGHTSQ